MRQDDYYFPDTLVAACKVIRFADGLRYESFAESDLRQSAIFNVREIADEAASSVSYEAKQAHPKRPWIQILCCRIRVVHSCSEIDTEVVRNFVRKDVRRLIRHPRIRAD